jgi:hypothetical protein
MIDANSQFFAILTNVGMAKQANADALGIPWKFTEMGVGDANNTDPIPSAAQTHLINEWRRRPLNQVRVDPVNPAVIIAEQIIPADEGGHWIREIGLYDADGDLVAVANCAPSFKPVLSQGSGRTQVVRMNFVVSSTGNITLKIDPAVVLATREYVDTKIQEELYKLDSKQSVQVATTANIALAGLQVIDGVSVPAGARVLVKDQAVAKDNGIYIAGAPAWVRAPDADTNAEVTSALLVSIEQGTTLADTRWQLITDGVIVLGSTALTFQNVTKGFAPLSSPAFVDNPTTPTPALDDSSKSIANTESVRAQIASPNQAFPEHVFRKNRLINGNFDVWQRGTSFTSTYPGPVTYTADRWRANATPAGSVTVTRQAFGLGQTEVSSEPSYFAQVVTAGGCDLNYRQRIESVKTLAGKQVTVSFYAKANSNISIDVYLGQYFGTGGSPSATVNLIQAINLTTAWQKFVLTYNVASIAGKTLGSIGDDFLDLLFFKATTNFTFSVARVQLEEGKVATPFESRPLAHELVLCQRYYEKSYNLDVTPGTLTRGGAALYQSMAAGAVGTSINIWFAGRKRINPVITTYNPDVANQQVRNASITTDCSGVAVGNLAQTCFSLNFVLPSGGGINQNLQVQWTADAEL